MIPKIIHYCWFGGNPKPKLMRKCIKSWQKYCPDYEIKEWNESNFDVHFNTYVEEAYNAKKWAFVSDVARIYALYNEGGIYLDTDVKLIKPLDKYLKYNAVFGFEDSSRIMTALMMGSEKEPVYAEILSYYDDNRFILEDGSFNLTPNPVIISDALKKQGFFMNNSRQEIDSIVIFPRDYFSPKDNITGELNKTSNTAAIHLFDASWTDTKNINHRKKRWRAYKKERIIGKTKAFIRKIAFFKR
ncbi:MAG: glycosyl transferase [Clostridia bacterium]|nr:glycosyl transferase [Clostridia bacterium]